MVNYIGLSPNGHWAVRLSMPNTVEMTRLSTEALPTRTRLQLAGGGPVVGEAAAALPTIRGVVFVDHRSGETLHVERGAIGTRPIATDGERFVLHIRGEPCFAVWVDPGKPNERCEVELPRMGPTAMIVADPETLQVVAPSTGRWLALTATSDRSVTSAAGQGTPLAFRGGQLVLGRQDGTIEVHSTDHSDTLIVDACDRVKMPFATAAINSAASLAFVIRRGAAVREVDVMSIDLTENRVLWQGGFQTMAMGQRPYFVSADEVLIPTELRARRPGRSRWRGEAIAEIRNVLTGEVCGRVMPPANQSASNGVVCVADRRPVCAAVLGTDLPEVVLFEAHGGVPFRTHQVG